VPSIPENETEVSLFNREMYEKFKLNPEVLCPIYAALVMLASFCRVVDSMGKLNGGM
jgi:hypothetical protein